MKRPWRWMGGRWERRLYNTSSLFCQLCQQDWIYVRELACDAMMSTPSYTHLFLETQVWGQTRLGEKSCHPPTITKNPAKTKSWWSKSWDRNMSRPLNDEKRNDPHSSRYISAWGYIQFCIHHVQKGFNGIRQGSISGLKTHISPILTLSSKGKEGWWDFVHFSRVIYISKIR